MYLGAYFRAVFEVNPSTTHTVFCFCQLFMMFASFIAFVQEAFQAREQVKYVIGAWASFGVNGFGLFLHVFILNAISLSLKKPSLESTEEQPIYRSHKIFIFGALYALGFAVAEIGFANLFANSPNRPLGTTIACGQASLTALAAIAAAVTDYRHIYHDGFHPWNIMSMGRLQYQRAKQSNSEGESIA